MINEEIDLEKFKPQNAIFGWGIDVDPNRRPGVPMEPIPSPDPDAHWFEPERQPESVEILKRVELNSSTPVFGTAQPPRGLSGVLRREAYSIAEHKASRWLLLLLADRVDVLENRIKQARKRPVLFATILAGTLLGYQAASERMKKPTPEMPNRQAA